MSDVVEIVAARIVVTGRVQGVGFRYFVSDLADQLGVTGWVKNFSDGRVEIEVYGVKEDIEMMIEKFWQGPPRASVSDVAVNWPFKGAQPNTPRVFQILR